MRAGELFQNGYFYACLAIFSILLAYFFIAASPGGDNRFPAGSLFTLKEGSSLSGIASALDGAGYIKNAFMFKALVWLTGGDDALKAGEYFFEEKQNVFHVANRLARGYFDLAPIKVLIPEGLSNKEISERLNEVLPRFNSENFLSEAEKHEGDLFPDTYFFMPGEQPNQIVRKMRENFGLHVGEIMNELNASGRSLEDVIIMASILEKEARVYETRQTIAGILWKRLEDGMPLQVDAVFLYILGKNTFDLTLDDLAYDSPYNTYKYKGLPPGAIANQGLLSMRAAIHSVESPYWFYLSDHGGITHYAVTFDEHKENKRKYLQ